MIDKEGMIDYLWDGDSILFRQAEHPSEKIINVLIAVLFLEVDW